MSNVNKPQFFKSSGGSICLAEGFLEASAEVSPRVLWGPQDFPRVCRGSDPMHVTRGNCRKFSSISTNTRWNILLWDVKVISNLPMGSFGKGSSQKNICKISANFPRISCRNKPYSCKFPPNFKPFDPVSELLGPPQPLRPFTHYG